MRAVSLRLPAAVKASKTVIAEVVQNGAKPRTLSVLGASVTPAPKRTVPVGRSKRVDPAALQVVVLLRARYTLPARSSLTIRLRTFTNPSYGVFPVLFALHTDKYVPTAWGIASWLVRYPKACRAGRPANDVVVENRATGSRTWLDGATNSGAIRGYADTRSAVCGEAVNLRVSTAARYFSVQAFRIGYYGGRGARLMWSSGPVLGGKRAIPAAVGRDRLVEARWPVSLQVPVTGAWTPGTYLFKFSNPDGRSSYYPFVVRETVPAKPVAGTALPTVVVVHGTTTKQVYNRWGPNPADPSGNSGYSGYYGPSGTAADRANKTSFDRPYDQTGDGGLVDESYPMIRFLEERGYNVSYVTDDQLETLDPLLLRAKTVVFPDHAEYWSATMRASVERLTAAKVNVAFFFGNTAYWRSRTETGPLGPKSRVVMYKYDAAGNPTDPATSGRTGRWRDPVVGNPEQALLGSQYSCVDTDLPLARPAGAATWLFAGTGLDAEGQSVNHIFFRETDQVYDDGPLTATRRVLASSAVDPVATPATSCQTGGGTDGAGNPRNATPARADLVISRVPSGAAVFNAGTFGWACQLYANCRWSKNDLAASRAIRAMTDNLLSRFVAGPAGALADPALTP